MNEIFPSDIERDMLQVEKDISIPKQRYVYIPYILIRMNSTMHICYMNL
jgi:hypothetical protein